MRLAVGPFDVVALRKHLIIDMVAPVALHAWIEDRDHAEAEVAQLGQQPGRARPTSRRCIPGWSQTQPTVVPLLASQARPTGRLWYIASVIGLCGPPSLVQKVMRRPVRSSGSVRSPPANTAASGSRTAHT